MTAYLYFVALAQFHTRSLGCMETVGLLHPREHIVQVHLSVPAFGIKKNEMKMKKLSTRKIQSFSNLEYICSWLSITINLRQRHVRNIHGEMNLPDVN